MVIIFGRSRSFFPHVRWIVYSDGSTRTEMEGNRTKPHPSYCVKLVQIRNAFHKDNRQHLFPLKHESASVQMFDHLVKVNNLEGVMEEYGLSLPNDLIFIKEQIAGPLDSVSSANKVQC